VSRTDSAIDVEGYGLEYATSAVSQRFCISGVRLANWPVERLKIFLIGPAAARVPKNGNPTAYLLTGVGCQE